MADLQCGIEGLIKSSLATNTQAVYSNARQILREFRQKYSFKEVWPVPSTQLEQFVSFLFSKGYAAKTVKTYISAISFQHKLYNMEDTTSSFSIAKMLEGYTRLRPSKDQRAPILYDTLVLIFGQLKSVCFSEYETRLFQAAYTLAFFGLFRVGELVLTSNVHPDQPLFRSDIIISDNRVSVPGTDVRKKTMKVRLRKSKTNQGGVPNIIDIRPIATQVCPVQAMCAFLSLRPNISQYLFCHANGMPLTRYQFSAVLNKTVQAARLPNARYRSHSFRIGAATWLAKRGVTNSTIKRMGRWSSNAFEKYIRL